MCDCFKNDIIKRCLWTGGYKLKESDGTTRLVEYTADDHNGFNAVVKKIGHAHHPQAYAKHHGGEWNSHGDSWNNNGYGNAGHHGHGAHSYSYYKQYSHW